jgi:hypothetical protein
LVKICATHSNEWKLTSDPDKSPTRCNNFSSILLDAHLQLNMFRASSRPSSGAQQLQEQPLVLPLERGDTVLLVVVGPA